MTATDAGPSDGPSRTDAPRWGFPDVVIAFVFAQIASAVGFVVFAAVQGTPVGELTTESLSITEVAILQLPLWFGLLGVPIVATRLRGRGPVLDLGLRSTWRDIPTGLGIGLASQLILVPLVTLPVFLLSDVDQARLEEPARELTDKAQGAGVLVLVFVVVVAAPLAEEVFFRGLLQRTLQRHWSTVPAIGATSIVFGVSHFQLLQFPALAAFGVVLSIVAHRTGRLGRNIWAHVGFNATTVIALLA